MNIDIYLEPKEVNNLRRGGFISLVLDDGIRITVTKDPEDEEDYEEE